MPSASFRFGLRGKGPPEAAVAVSFVATGSGARGYHSNATHQLPTAPLSPMPPKAKTVYRCTECGAEYPKWQGRCESCGEWNTLVEEAAPQKVAAGKAAGAQR